MSCDEPRLPITGVGDRAISDEPVDYKASCILTRDKTSGEFLNEGRVRSCCVVGAVVEACLRLAYRPAIDCLPFPLALQTSALFLDVQLRDVLLKGEAQVRKTLAVKVYSEDADLALAVVRAAVGTLQQHPYNLEVLSVDHTGGSSCLSSHDLLMTPRLGVVSCLASRLYSIELRCREVIDKKAFDWEGVLTAEALPLLTAEQRKKRKLTEPLLHGRILVFACFPRPCRVGFESLHASINYGSGWERLWGWSGFNGESNALPACPQPQPQAQTQSKAQVRVVEAPDVQWEKFKAKPGMQGTWVKLLVFCRNLKISSNQAKRDYLEGPNAWRVPTRNGCKLVYHEDWIERPGDHGGVPATFVHSSKLEEVFLKYFVER